MAIAELFNISREGLVGVDRTPKLIKSIIFTNAQPSKPDFAPTPLKEPDLPRRLPKREPVPSPTPLPEPVEVPVAPRRQPVPV